MRLVASLEVIDDGAILLVSKNGKNWNLPGGEIRKGEKAIEALARELLEELSAKPLVLPDIRRNVKCPSHSGAMTQYIIFSCTRKNLGPLKLNGADKVNHYMWTTHPHVFDLNPVTRKIADELIARRPISKK